MTTEIESEAAGYARIARGLRITGGIFGVIGLFMLWVAILTSPNGPKPHEVARVTAEDFSDSSSQAILKGTLQVRTTQLHLSEPSEMSTRLTGGQTMTVLTPFTSASWTAGESVPVYIVSPDIPGVTRETMQLAARDYMGKLQSQPDNMLVTLLPAKTRSAQADALASAKWTTDDTLFVWPDHVVATEYGAPKREFGFLQPVVTLLVALAFLIVGGYYGRRASI